MASNGKEAEFHLGVKNNASIVNASPTLIVSKNADGTYEHTLPGNIPLTSTQITTALGYIPIGANSSMTGLSAGALITINTDTAKFNISAGSGFIVNGNIAVPTVTPVTITASTANIIPNIATQKITYVAVDSTGALYLTNAPLIATERRSYIRLGRIVHLNNTSINSINNQPTVNKEAGGQVQDILEALGFRSLSGNRVFPVSNNLKIKKELGRVFKSGSNFATLATQPHSFTLPAQDPITFRYRTQTGSEGADITDITPAIYDLNGTITAVGSTATLATIQRIYIFQDGIIRIQPGQRVFTTLNGAVTALNSDVFITDLDIENNALYLGAIVLTRNTVNLADIAQAIFVPSGQTNVNGSAPSLGFTPEDIANKQNNLNADGTGAKYLTVDGANALLPKLLGAQTFGAGEKTFDDNVNFSSIVVATTAVGQAATLSNQFVVKSQLDAIKPYKCYVALVTQSGTAFTNSNVTILENTTGAVITWAYSSPGGYTGTSTGLFTASKTAILFSNGSANNGVFGASRSSNNNILLTSSEATSNSPANGLIQIATIEIRIYP